MNEPSHELRHLGEARTGNQELPGIDEGDPALGHRRQERPLRTRIRPSMPRGWSGRLSALSTMTSGARSSIVSRATIG